VNAENLDVNVIGERHGDRDAVTGTYDLRWHDVLELGDGADISVNEGDGRRRRRCVAGATMTTAQHEAFATVTGAGSADAITLTTTR
jgi:hypothetical protein